MRRSKIIKLTMGSGKEWYLPESELTSLGISTDPIAAVGNMIRGSRLPLARVNTLADMTGTFTHINVARIEEVHVTYSDPV